MCYDTRSRLGRFVVTMSTGSATPLDVLLWSQERRQTRGRGSASAIPLGSPLLTVREVAALLRCAEKTVRAAIGRGELVAELHGGRLLVDERELANYRKARRTSPPPQPARPVRAPQQPGGRKLAAGSLEHLEAIETEAAAR